MAPASVVSSSCDFHRDYSTFTTSKLARDGVSLSSSFALNDPPATPDAKPSNGFVPLRPSAEKFNPNGRFRPQRSPAVPEADLNTSKLAAAFPGFSGIVEDVKPSSPNPFAAKATGHKLKMPSWAKPLQPRVRDENDVSIAAEAHSSPARLGNKDTRSSSITVPKTRKGPQPHMYKPAPGLVQNAAAFTSAGEAKAMAINAQGSLTTMPNGSTQPTLNLPQAPTLTDLFSGVVRHPPPKPAQQVVRPRASRFASAAKTQRAAEAKSEAVPVPVDERQLLESIDILQTRVAELEGIKAQLEVTNTNLDQKNFELEVEKRELTARRRSDSAVSVPDDASHDSKGHTAAHRRLAAERNRLESACWALQGQKDLLLRDVGTAETAVEKITQERDHQKAQLAATEMCIKSLQTEKRSIGQQRDQAIAQLATTDARAETLSQENKALLEENQELRAHIAFLMQGSAAQEDMSHHSTLDNADADATEGPLDMDTISLMNQQKAKELQKERVQVQDKPVQHHDDSLESSHNITYLSYAGDSSMCKVRKTLEQERRARQQRRQADAAGNAYVSRVETQKEFGVQAPNEQSRECSESSVIKRPKRSSIPREELTSGFIVPDITFDQQRMTEAQASLELPANTQHHSDLVQQPQPSEQIAESRQQVQPEQVAGPRQITDEELDITIHDEEPTIRPTQAPEVALAVVLESLGAELAEQRAQLAKYQNSYARQDVTISRRQRKQIHAKIQALLDACEVKAEQIYNLHDVIEGQKQQGPPVTHDQIDNTLQSLGLDLPWEGLDSRRRSTASSRSI